MKAQVTHINLLQRSAPAYTVALTLAALLALTVIGLAYWIFNMFYKVLNAAEGVRPVGVISIIILLGFISGVRGTFAFSKFSKQPVAVTAG